MWAGCGMITSKFTGSSTADDVVAGLDLSGRRIVVTGASAGIGFETARALAAAGAEVVLACRSRASSEATAERIRSAHPRVKLRTLEIELGSFASVRKAAAELAAQPVDVAICNAGVYGPYEETEDGFERTVGVSHLGHFLFVTSLLPALRAAPTARVVMVSSESHRSPRRLDFSRFPVTRASYKPLIAYGQAKLCNVLFANELTRRFGSEGIVANSLHPGTLMKTSIGRSSKLAAGLLWLARPFTKSLAQGAATSVYCATAPALAGIGGRYFVDCHERLASSEARDADVARRLWELSERWTSGTP
jgi:WW domain-containing oxidoreductase